MSAPMVRLVAQLVGSIGVSKVVNDIIVNNTTIATTTDAVRVWAGSIVIGSMIADQASTHINDRITEVFEWRRKHETVTTD